MVETDNSVVRSEFMDMKDVYEFLTCSKKRSKDVAESERSKNVVRA